MFLKPAKLGEKEIPESILSEDKKHCKKIGPCGIGKEALYLNSFYLERRFYIRYLPSPVFLSVWQ